MRRSTVLFTALLALCIALPAAAEEPAAADPAASGSAGTGRGLRLKPNAKWHLLGHSLGLPAYFILQCSLHEGSHAFAATTLGLEVTDFRPYPHMLGENFVFGSMGAKGTYTPKGEAWLVIAPAVTDITLFTASDLMLTYAVNDDSPAAPFLLAGGMVAPLVDFLVGINGQSAFNDTSRFAKLTGMPKWSIMLIGDAMAAVAVWRILHHGYYIFFEHGHSAVPTQPNIAVAPSFLPGGAGLSLTGRF